VTPAEELRAAATRLREIATKAEWCAPVSPVVAEPLADWLEEEARQYELPPCNDPTGVCNRCEYDPTILAALTVARAINGGAP
jgi:hypothetical protein